MLLNQPIVVDDVSWSYLYRSGTTTCIYYYTRNLFNTFIYVLECSFFVKCMTITYIAGMSHRAACFISI